MKKYILGLFILILTVTSFNRYRNKESYQMNEMEDATISLTIDESVSETFPSKESGKTIESIKCDNDAIGGWDYEAWGPIIRNVNKTRTKCQFNFITKYSDRTVKKAYLGREWYANQAHFPRDIFPWFIRGAVFSQGNEGGVFAFDNATGNAGSYGYRIVLSF